MNSALEFHDSEIARIDAVGRTLRVRFSAACVHRSAGAPGVDAGKGFLQAVSMELDDATWDAELAPCHGRVAEGAVRVNGIDIGLPTIPGARSGEIRLWIRFSSGAEFSAGAVSLRLAVDGEARFIEDFSC